MKFALFYHSVISDWNHGNAHFLRGMMRALQQRGHAVVCYEQSDNWSLQNLLAEKPTAIADFEADFPDLHYVRYAADDHLDETLRAALQAADVAIVHEWNAPDVIKRLGELGQQVGTRMLFHDTHYRVVLDDDYRAQLGLEHYADILAYSPSVAQRFADLGFQNVHVVHEAADPTVFYPRAVPQTTDVVFIGNYGDGDRSDEIDQFIFGPRQGLPDLRFAMYGVRYPDSVVQRMRNGLDVEYRGRLANVDVPQAYSAAKVVLHVPRRQYVQMLPGTPTIRVFEALATGACLVSLPWPDTDHLFRAGEDFLTVATPAEMREALRWLTADDAARTTFGQHGRETILARHTCGRRADQLLGILNL